jgi:hypothetical protein
MLCLSGSAYPTQPHIDRANPGESRVSWSPGLKPRVVFCGNRDRARSFAVGCEGGRAEALTARSSFPSSDLMRSGYNARYRCLR